MRAMGFQEPSLFFTFTLFLIVSLFPLISSSHPKPMDGLVFLKNLNGCKKGDKVEGIHQMKKYLQHFGYMNNDVHIHSKSSDDEFDEILEFAVKTYQINYNLKATGTLDNSTISQMSKPRCGVADIINGRTGMKSGKRLVNRHRKIIGHFHEVSHFAFFEGNLKWPNSKSHLTYGKFNVFIFILSITQFLFEF